MDADDAMQVFQDHINKSIDAKVKPLLDLIMGLETTLAHVFNTLHHKGVLSRQDAIASIRDTARNLPPNASAAARMPLEHIARHLEQLDTQSPQPDPDSMPRTHLRLIEGGLSDAPS